MMVSRHLGSPLTLMGSGEVENLQRALTNLAVATGRPASNPGPITGEVTDATMTALASSIGLLTESLPAEVYLPLQGAFAFGATSATAKKIVGQYATQLTVACNTAAVKFKNNTGSAPGKTITAGNSGTILMPSTGPMASISQFFAPGWYKTPFGLLLIAGSAYLTYRFLFADPKKA